MAHDHLAQRWVTLGHAVLERLAAAGREDRVGGGAELLDREGLDDFGRKALGRLERIEIPPAGTAIRCGEQAFTLRRGAGILRLPAPVSGTVAHVNSDLHRDVGLLRDSPYDRGWVCVLQPSNLAEELPQLRIGKAVVAWYQDEIVRLRRELPAGGDAEMPWPELQSKFFAPGREAPSATLEPVGS